MRKARASRCLGSGSHQQRLSYWSTGGNIHGLYVLDTSPDTGHMCLSNDAHQEAGGTAPQQDRAGAHRGPGAANPSLLVTAGSTPRLRGCGPESFLRSDTLHSPLRQGSDGRCKGSPTGQDTHYLPPCSAQQTMGVNGGRRRARKLKLVRKTKDVELQWRLRGWPQKQSPPRGAGKWAPPYNREPRDEAQGSQQQGCRAS